MLDELLKLVSNNAQQAIVNNDAIPNEHNEAAIQEVTNTIQSGLAEHAAGGGLDSIVQMFGGKAGDLANNPMVQNMINNAAASLAAKFSVDPAQASSIAKALIPQVMNQFTQKTADPNDNSFDLNSVISSFSGGNASGAISGLISKFF